MISNGYLPYRYSLGSIVVSKVNQNLDNLFKITKQYLGTLCEEGGVERGQLLVRIVAVEGRGDAGVVQQVGGFLHLLPHAALLQGFLS